GARLSPSPMPNRSSDPVSVGRGVPRVGFDCSQLVHAAYAAAGIQLPRVAQEQFDVGPPVPSESPVQPGDLVLGDGRLDVCHVGIYVGAGEMIDAFILGLK